MLRSISAQQFRYHACITIVAPLQQRLVMGKDDKKKGGKGGDKKPFNKYEIKQPGKLIVISDDCLTPKRAIDFVYSGPDAFKLASSMVGFFGNFFKVSSAGYSEEKFSWDGSGDPANFLVQWWVKKKMSRFTSLKFLIKVQGDEFIAAKKGRFTLEIKSMAEHVFPHSWWERGIFAVYHYMFYSKLRREYIKRCRQLSYGFMQFLKTQLGLETTTSRDVEPFK